MKINQTFTDKNAPGKILTIKAFIDKKGNKVNKYKKGLYIKSEQGYHDPEYCELCECTYLFASVRGEDFESSGTNPEEAYLKLVEREKDNGSLWRLNDFYRNRTAVQKEGFKYLFDNVVYKLKQ